MLMLTLLDYRALNRTFFQYKTIGKLLTQNIDVFHICLKMLNQVQCQRHSARLSALTCSAEVKSVFQNEKSRVPRKQLHASDL